MMCDGEAGKPWAPEFQQESDDAGGDSEWIREPLR